MQSDREFFCQKIREYEGSMYAAAYGILRNQDDAADIIQESILKAYCSLDTLQNPRQFKPWIMRIIHNTAIDFLRKNRNLADYELEEEVPDERHSVDADTKMTLWQAVEKLKLPYRLVIILFYYKDYSIQEISQVTGAPQPAVRQQLSRGRKMLAKLLNKEDFEQ